MAPVIGHSRRHGDGVISGCAASGLRSSAPFSIGCKIQPSSRAGSRPKRPVDSPPGHRRKRRPGPASPPSDRCLVGETAGRIEKFLVGAGRHPAARLPAIAPANPRAEGIPAPVNSQRRLPPMRPSPWLVRKASNPASALGRAPRLEPFGCFRLRLTGAARHIRWFIAAAASTRRFAERARCLGQQGVGQPCTQRARLLHWKRPPPTRSSAPLGQLDVQGAGAPMAPTWSARGSSRAAEAASARGPHHGGRGGQRLELGATDSRNQGNPRFGQGADHQGQLDRRASAADPIRMRRPARDSRSRRSRPIKALAPYSSSKGFLVDQVERRGGPSSGSGESHQRPQCRCQSCRPATGME